MGYLKFFLVALVTLILLSYFGNGTLDRVPYAKETREPVISTEVAETLANLRSNHPNCVSNLIKNWGQPIGIRVENFPNAMSNFGSFDQLLTFTFDTIYNDRVDVVRFLLRNEANGSSQIVGSNGELIPAKYDCR